MGVLAPPLLSVALLSPALGFDHALFATAGTWTGIGKEELTSNRFYQLVLGTFDLRNSLLQMLLWSLAYALLMAFGAFLMRCLPAPLRQRGTRPRGLAIAVFLVVAVAILSMRFRGEWIDCTRPLPLVLLAAMALCARTLWQQRRQGEDTQRAELGLTLLVFSFLLLAKVVLAARLDHYGFALVMPATLALVAIWVSAWPELVERSWPGAGLLQRAVGLAVLLAAFVGIGQIFAVFHGQRQTAVGEPGDEFLAGRLGPFVNLALEDLRGRMEPDDTLLVLPEGVMLNYLLRKQNPTPYISFMPPEVILFGEDPMLQSLRESPPDYVAVVHRLTTEYGLPYFGQHYGQEVLGWVRQNYRPAQRIGDPPLMQPDGFGILLLRHQGS
jgi:hypothetical protein